MQENKEENAEYDDEHPCYDCERADFCDGWEAQFCCALCKYHGGGDCDSCDPMDI